MTRQARAARGSGARQVLEESMLETLAPAEPEREKPAAGKPVSWKMPRRGPWRGAAALAVAFLTVSGLACSGSGARDSSGGAGGGEARGGPPPVPVEVKEVELRDVQYTIQAVGSIEAWDVIRVPARVAGVIQNIAFEEGQAVNPGKVLARIDPERYSLAAQRAEANYRQAEAQAREAEAALAKRQALKQKDAGWVSDEELSNFTAQLDQAKAAAASAKAAWEIAKKDLADSFVRAEKAGMINEKVVSTGQYVTAGTPVATIVDARRLKLSFKVAESEAVRLSQASRITFRVKAIPGREFEAKMYHIGAAADPATRMVDCLAWVENPGNDLRPGFFADVTAEVGERKGSLVVPQTAVLPTDRGFVGFVLKGADRVEKRSFRLGLYTKDGKVEILEGLQPGDKVIVRGAAILTEDSVVAPVPAVAKPAEKNEENT
ncbi:MAG TPA: efflux RND transporter periplasmic adaptor subunit [Candidatus Polarisedimenticolia bacterium]|nr:efflux RND transporter periplasmic adaptor subunit [Candidatus Polarisedimenticolia bacterium]